MDYYSGGCVSAFLDSGFTAGHQIPQKGTERPKRLETLWGFSVTVCENAGHRKTVYKPL